MMKRLSILVFILSCAMAVSAQHQRRVLIEEFTNASCPPCAAQNPGFNAVVDANIQYLTPVKYQTNWPGYDPMNVQTQSDVGPRVTYYGVTGVPNGRQNGSTEVFPLSNFTPAVIQQQYNNLTPVTINVSHALNATFDSVFISVAVKSETELTGNLRLRVAVVEDEIIFESAPGTNGEKDFYQIMRKMLPNSAGTSTGDFAAGETKTYNFAWKLAYFYDLNQMSVAAWLQNDGTKEVYQSERSEPLPPVPSLGISIPSENVFACAAGYSPKFTMTNTGEANLTSALIRYRQGNGAWTDLNWTGDLAPGASEEVTLNDIVINTNGTVNVEVAVISSNLGIQTNLAGGSSIIKVTANVNAAQVLPFGNTFQSAAFPPPGWSSINVGSNGWKLATNAGAGSTRSARCNFYDMGDGQTAYLFTPKIDLSTATNTTTLTFDHAYAQYTTLSFIDHLGIEVSTDCGITWESIFYVGGADLTTAPPSGSAFTPTASQWAANSIDMTPFNGQAEILIRFVGESGYGNNLYIDNVNVTTTVGTQALTLNNFLVAPNPARDFAEVRFNLVNAQNVDIRVFNADGALAQSQLLGNLVSGDHRVVLNTATLPSGSYRVVLQGSEGLAQTQMIVVK